MFQTPSFMGLQYGPVHIPAVVQLDLGDLNMVKEKTTEILQIYGYIDILINNAGMSHRGNVLETTIEVDQRLMTVNYFGPLTLTKGMVIFYYLTSVIKHLLKENANSLFYYYLKLIL